MKEQAERPARALTALSSSGVAAVRCATTSTRAEVDEAILALGFIAAAAHAAGRRARDGRSPALVGPPLALRHHLDIRRRLMRDARKRK